jgi:hypothetical protein
VRGDRRFAGGFDEDVQRCGWIEDTNRRDPDRGATSIMPGRDSIRIAALVEFPKRSDPRVHALPARPQHLPADRRMGDLSIADDRVRDGDGSFGIVSGLPDSPLVFRIAAITRDDVAGCPFETTNAVCVPSGDLRVRQHLGLLADGVAGRDPNQAPANAIRSRDSWEILCGVR